MAVVHRINPGDKFGRLTVVAKVGGGHANRLRYQCKCACGKYTLVLPFHLTNGRTRSCGCLMVQNRTKGTKYRHGEAIITRRTPEYGTWLGIKARCNNPKEPAYKYYGAKGVKVCARWGKFENFLSDMGRRPKGMTLDRIDPHGDYDPSNCRWATDKQQQQNKRNAIRISHMGETLCVAEWARRTGIGASTIQYRLNHGWEPIEAISVPIIRRDRALAGEN